MGKIAFRRAKTSVHVASDFARADRCRADRATPFSGAGPGAGRLRPPRRGLRERSPAHRRSRPLRGALRARSALPRLGLLLSRDRERQCRVLAQVAGHGAGAGAVLRLGGARHRGDRAAQRGDRVRLRPLRRGPAPSRRRGRPQRQELPGGVRGGGRLPRLDLCAAGLRRALGGLLSQGPDHAAHPQAVLHLRRCALDV